ncbi:MAG: rod shape-determining protein MreD [Pseudomonadota bacterium]
MNEIEYEMSRRVLRLWLLVLSSALIALILNLVRIPITLDWYRPEFVVMVIIFWGVAEPHRIGLSTAWILGLLMDVLENGILGVQALSLSVIIYLTYLLHPRLRAFRIVQQSATVFLLVGIFQLLVRIVNGVLGPVPDTPLYWMPSFTSALIWPFLVLILRLLSRAWRITD